MRADTGSVPRSDYRSGRAAEDLHLPRVSVVIPTFNKYEYTRRCLESLRELVYPDIEIIVVDNASIDGTPDKIGVEFPPFESCGTRRTKGTPRRAMPGSMRRRVPTFFS